MIEALAHRLYHKLTSQVYLSSVSPHYKVIPCQNICPLACLPLTYFIQCHRHKNVEHAFIYETPCLVLRELGYCTLCTGDKEMAKWLVDNYPEVGDIPNVNGDLPVHFAAAQGEKGCVMQSEN